MMGFSKSTDLRLKSHAFIPGVCKRTVSVRTIEGYFGVMGRPANLVYYTRDAEHKPSQPFRVLDDGVEHFLVERPVKPEFRQYN